MLPFDFAKAVEDDSKVVVGGDRVELADEEDVLRRCDVGVRQVSYNLQDRGSRLRLPLLLQLLNLLGTQPSCLIHLLICPDSSILYIFATKKYCQCVKTVFNNTNYFDYRDREFARYIKNFGQGSRGIILRSPLLYGTHKNHKSTEYFTVTDCFINYIYRECIGSQFMFDKASISLVDKMLHTITLTIIFSPHFLCNLSSSKSEVKRAPIRYLGSSSAYCITNKIEPTSNH